ncbi:MAG: 2,5-dihydroxypyridine 5,6-dioxygenase, partial [Actinomycetota bacterium]|nr:2,5-dihydroxypyridine 5,6-dioxygenase [Actinomycetota bacterium]
MYAAGFDNLLDRCLAVREGEQVLLVTDEGTDQEVVAGLEEGIARRGAEPRVALIPVPDLPGAEPPSTVAATMLEAGAVIELTSLFIGSSSARQQATRAGVRYLAMPGVRLETFRDDGPLTVDFDSIRADAEQIGRAWDGAERFRLTTPGGTDLRGSVAGRPGRVLHGLAREPGDYMAPPDIEAGTAPVEGTTSGVVVVDADLLFMGQGPLPEPVVIHIERGEMVGLEGAEAGRLEEMLARCADERMGNIAEVSMA